MEVSDGASAGDMPVCLPSLFPGHSVTVHLPLAAPLSRGAYAFGAQSSLQAVGRGGGPHVQPVLHTYSVLGMFPQVLSRLASPPLTVSSTTFITSVGLLVALPISCPVQ